MLPWRQFIVLIGLPVSATHPVLFLPGTLCDERVFLPLWRQLSLAQRRYVPLQWASTLDDMMALTGDRVLSDEKVHLVGYSMGGFIAAKWACQHMQHVASITLIGYDASGLSKDELVRRKHLVSALTSGKFNLSDEQYLNRFIHPTYRHDDGVAGTVQSMANDLGKNTLLAHTQATTPRENLIPMLAKSKVPISIIAASDDNIAPLAQLSAMANALPSAALNIIDASGHMLPIEQPHQVAAIISKTIGA
jgi:pimeloyl-ACP methyl ester carboxylesterase